MKNLYLVACVIFGGNCFAQNSIPLLQFGNFQQNSNPAFSGFSEKSQLNVNYSHNRYGNSFLSNSANINYGIRIKNNHGLGVNINTDQNVPYTYSKYSINYNYQFLLNNDSKLAIGLAPSLTTFKTPDFINNTDEIVRMNAVNLNFGVAYSYKNLTVGTSYESILNDDIQSNNWRFSKGLSMYGKYVFDISENFKLIPEIELRNLEYKKIPGLATNVNALLYNKISLGIGFNPGYAGMHAGYTFKNNFAVNYAFMATPFGDHQYSHQVGIKYSIK